MLNKVKRLIFYSSLVICSGVFGQVMEPTHTFTVEVGLPNGFTNPSFKSIMQGLVNTSAYYQYDFKNHLTIGGGMRYGYYTINEFRVPSPVSGGMHTAGGYLKFGWQKFTSDRFALDLGVKLGYSKQWFVTDRNDTLGVNPMKLNCFYLEPTIGLVLTADERNSYRFFVSYAMFDFGFKPSLIGLETFGGYDPADFEKITGSLIVGFGYTYYLKKD